MGCKIVGHGKAQPELVVSNDDLANIVDTSDEWIVERTGIHNRRIAVDESTTDLGVQAAQAALENAGVAAVDIDLIVCMTISGDVIVPSQAALIKAQLGAEHAIAFDLNAACSGCIYGIDVASTMIEASVASEGGSGIGLSIVKKIIEDHGGKVWATSKEHTGTVMYFGDGAGAVVLEWDESAPGILASFLKNTDDDTLCLTVDANHDMSTFPFGENVGNVGVGEIMDIETDEGGFAEHAAFIRMHGQRVFKFATAAIVEAARAVCERAGVSMDEVSCIVPHQANDRIIRFAAKKLGVPYERWQVSIAEAGNTSASSVLMALSDAYDDGRIAPGDKVLCVGFGGGLTSGALLFEA